MPRSTFHVGKEGIILRTGRRLKPQAHRTGLKTRPVESTAEPLQRAYRSEDVTLQVQQILEGSKRPMLLKTAFYLEEGSIFLVSELRPPLCPQRKT